MVRKKNCEDPFPVDDRDLSSYIQKWEAGKNHCDYKNTVKCDNRYLFRLIYRLSIVLYCRYLLFGLTQFGKTGVFLHLGYLLWQRIGRPEHSSPEVAGLPTFELDFEGEEEEGEEEEEEPQEQQLRNQGVYPDYTFMKDNETLVKPAVSQAYGDPNDPNVLDWYRQGNWCPHESVASCSNNTMKKAIIGPTSAGESAISGQTTSIGQQKKGRKHYSKFASRTLKKSENFGSQWKDGYLEFNIELEGREGSLLLNRKSTDKKWNVENPCPTLKNEVVIPPIIIPSCNRHDIALLDLTEAMERKKDYVQIVMIRKKEENNYLEYLLDYEDIDIFVMADSTPPTIGAARMTAKKLAERMTSNFCFIQDDRISHFQAITLINDPHPPIENAYPSDEYSQSDDISLRHFMDYILEGKKELENFSIIGLSTSSHRGIYKRKEAFGRKHLFAAVLLNLEKLRGIDYNENFWAMEDTDFNMRTDENGGVLVKCQRFIAWKVKLDRGGVEIEDSTLNKNVPDTNIPGGGDITHEGRDNWFKPFCQKRRYWSQMLLMESIDEDDEMVNSTKWMAEMFETKESTAKKLTRSIDKLIHDENTAIKERIKRIVKLLRNVEQFLRAGPESDQQIINFVEENYRQARNSPPRKRRKFFNDLIF